MIVIMIYLRAFSIRIIYLLMYCYD